MPVSKGNMATDKEPLTVYLEPEIKAALEAWARKEQRSMSFLGANAIAAAVEEWQQSQPPSEEPPKRRRRAR